MVARETVRHGGEVHQCNQCNKIAFVCDAHPSDCFIRGSLDIEEPGRQDVFFTKICRLELQVFDSRNEQCLRSQRPRSKGLLDQERVVALSSA